VRFIHTSDWHLGRLFHGVHLTQDQSVVLDQFVDLVREARPDFILIAGDLYDRAVPPPEAIELLDDVFCRLVLDLKVPVVAIAGNHDSPQRIEFGARLLSRHGLHLCGLLSDRLAPLEFRDAHGPVRLHVLPYAEPSWVRQCLQQDDIHTHEEAMRALTARLCDGAAHAGNGSSGPAPAGDGPRSILMTHAFVAGGKTSESERPLTVGGAGCVDGVCFEPFNYVALGHLHFPHAIHREEIRYSGSLMKYSFSEAEHRKCVHVVEMDAQGRCRVEAINLKPRRDVRRVSGTLAALLNGPADGDGREDYLEVTLEDRGAIYDAMGQLRQVYPNVLHIRRLTLGGDGPAAACEPRARATDAETFASFCQYVADGPPTDEEAEAFASVINATRSATA
jgi:exonuclease SbcD